MFVLGVTGPSGAGKGTVCGILKDFGFYHIDTDRLVPGVYPEAIPQLIEAFGVDVVKDGSVDKRALAAAAFSSEENTEKLNQIIHPLVMRAVAQQIETAKELGFDRVTVDGAALHEAHAETICDRMLCVLAPRNLRKQRVMERDSISSDAADLRLSAQKPDDFYTNNTDAVIINDDRDNLKSKLFQLIKEWVS
ncbi:MAG: dephospho-CoA kinase [Clostridia bacterium]|nr:dephospho-CoA kinase [Clostridia bacterium]